MTRIITFVALAVAFSSSPVLAADDMNHEQAGSQSQTAHRANDDHVAVQQQKGHDHDRATPRPCECKHDGKAEPRAMPKLNLSEDTLAPVN